MTSRTHSHKRALTRQQRAALTAKQFRRLALLEGAFELPRTGRHRPILAVIVHIGGSSSTLSVTQLAQMRTPRSGRGRLPAAALIRCNIFISLIHFTIIGLSWPVSATQNKTTNSGLPLLERPVWPHCVPPPLAHHQTTRRTGTPTTMMMKTTKTETMKKTRRHSQRVDACAICYSLVSSRLVHRHLRRHRT